MGHSSHSIRSTRCSSLAWIIEPHSQSRCCITLLKNRCILEGGQSGGAGPWMHRDATRIESRLWPIKSLFRMPPGCTGQCGRPYVTPATRLATALPGGWRRASAALMVTDGANKDMVSIRQRLAAVEDRGVPGHWEGDLLTELKNGSSRPGRAFAR